MEEKAGGFISKIIFNNGAALDVEKNGIVVFVGPNNVGKSQALKDIYALSEKGQNGLVVSGVEITKSGASLVGLLDSISTGRKDGGFTYYEVLGNRIALYDSLVRDFPTSPYYWSLRSLFMVELSTAARLNICAPPRNITRDAPKTHPIHYAAFESEHRKWLSNNFKKAFNVEVTPNILNGANIPLCIGEPVRLSGAYSDSQEHLEAYAGVLSGYRQVQKSGRRHKKLHRHPVVPDARLFPHIPHRRARVLPAPASGENNGSDNRRSPIQRPAGLHLHPQ